MAQTPSSIKYILEKEYELRFEVEDYSRKLLLELKAGFAEVFGAELTGGKKYEFGYGSKVAVFSWQGCTLELSFKPRICYLARGTPMPIYLNCHAALENMRHAAEMQGQRGPVVLVAGPPDVGKSSLCHLLLNYAVKSRRKPLYVDLNPDLGHVSVPGTVCALPIEKPATVPGGFRRLMPLVFNFGYYSPESNVTLFNALVEALAERSFSRIQRSRNLQSAGIIIDTCGVSKDAVYDTLLHAAKTFEVDVVFVIDNEKLSNQLSSDLPGFIKVLGIPKNGGVVERTVGQRMEARRGSLENYFYGWPERLTPRSYEIKFDELKLYTTIPQLPSCCLPTGMVVDPLSRKLSPYKLTAELRHHLLALSFAEDVDENATIANVMGFVCVTGVDLENRLITVLSPHSSPLPTHHLFFISQVQFFDSI